MAARKELSLNKVWIYGLFFQLLFRILFLWNPAHGFLPFFYPPGGGGPSQKHTTHVVTYPIVKTRIIIVGNKHKFEKSHHDHDHDRSEYDKYDKSASEEEKPHYYREGRASKPRKPYVPFQYFQSEDKKLVGDVVRGLMKQGPEESRHPVARVYKKEALARPFDRKPLRLGDGPPARTTYRKKKWSSPLASPFTNNAFDPSLHDDMWRPIVSSSLRSTATVKNIERRELKVKCRCEQDVEGDTHVIYD